MRKCGISVGGGGGGWGREAEELGRCSIVEK